MNITWVFHFNLIWNISGTGYIKLNKKFLFQLKIEDKKYIYSEVTKRDEKNLRILLKNVEHIEYEKHKFQE